MINTNKFQGVFFDLDGTLIYSEALSFRAWNKALEEFNLKIQEQDYSLYIGKSGNKIEETIKKNLGIDFKEDYLSKKRNEIFEHFIKTEPLKLAPYATKVLVHFKQQKLSLGLVSAGHREATLIKLRRTKLLPFFDVIICQEDVLNKKPLPEPYLTALLKAGIAPENAMAVEDSQSGVLSAKGAGLFTVAIPNSFTQKQDFSAANIKMKNLNELIKFT